MKEGVDKNRIHHVIVRTEKIGGMWKSKNRRR